MRLGSGCLFPVPADAELTFDDGSGQFLDAGIFPPDIENLAAVVHHDMAIADIERVVEVVGDEYRTDAVSL